MTDTTKYFDQNSKKRDLTGDWNQEKAAKELKERSLNTNTDIPDEALTDSLKSSDCVNILSSCIKNVEKQIEKEKQIVEVKEAIDFISNQFDEYEKDRKEKEERIKTLEDCLINMSKLVDSLSGQIDK